MDNNKYVHLFPSLDIDNLRKESDDITSIPSFTIVEEKSQFLIDFLANIENKPLNEINSFILRYHTSFLNYNRFTESEASRSTMQRVFTNTIFLNELLNCISKLQLDNYEISFINRISYDYWTLNDKDDNICNLLLLISSYVNNNLIIKLSSKLAVNEAKILAMISNSTIDEEVRIHRINRFLVNCDNPVLETQSMIDIMFFLYDRFLNPIIYTLLESEACCNTEETIPQYHKLMNAIITILLSVPKEKMIKILTEYGYLINGRVNMAGTNKVRKPTIKLKEIKDDRLQEVIKTIEYDQFNFIKEIP